MTLSAKFYNLYLMKLFQLFIWDLLYKTPYSWNNIYKQFPHSKLTNVWQKF